MLIILGRRYPMSFSLHIKIKNNIKNNLLCQIFFIYLLNFKTKTMKNTKTQTLNCKICDREVKNVGHDAVKVTCYVCVNKSMLTGISLDEDEDIKQNEIED